MKYAKFGLILVSALAISGCDDSTATGDATFTDSVLSGVSSTFSVVPETFSMYANASATHDELIAVKRELQQTQQRLQSSLAANAAHAQFLQKERDYLKGEMGTIDVAMQQVQQLKQRVAQQGNDLLDLSAALSTRTEDNSPATKTAKQTAQPGLNQRANSAKTTQQRPLKITATPANQLASEATIAQRQRAEQQKLRQKKLREQKLQQQKLRQKKLQEQKLQQQKAPPQSQAPIGQQPVRAELRASDAPLKQLLQLRKREQQAVQYLDKTQKPKKLEMLTLEG